VRINMLLADAAQAVNGKLYVLGGGWSVIAPGRQSMAIALDIKTPWDQTNVRHKIRIELLDSDGNAVEADGNPVLLEGEFEVGRPIGVKAGTPIDSASVVDVVGVELPPGERLEWRVSIDGDSREEWTLPFTTRAAEQETKAA
jgi:hypothetical protein